MTSCYCCNMVFDSRSLLTRPILTEVKWRGLCQAALLARLCSGTLQGGDEQKAFLWPSCLRHAQLSIGCTAVCTAHGCPHGTQLSAGCTAVHRLSHCPHGTQLRLGHTYLWGSQLCMAHSYRKTQSSLRGAHLSAGCTSVSGHTAVCSCSSTASP